MKIFQFTPNLSPKTPADPARRPEAGGFAEHLKAASAGPAGPGGVVSLENRRALRLPSTVDLGQAGQLLSRLDRSIRRASPEALRQVHDLEGLVCLYRRANPSQPPGTG